MEILALTIHFRRRCAMIDNENINPISLAPDKLNVDSKKRIDREIDGCKVRLFFITDSNDKVERTVLDNLMFVYEQKREFPNVQTQNSYLRQLP